MSENKWQKFSADNQPEDRAHVFVYGRTLGAKHPTVEICLFSKSPYDTGTFYDLAQLGGDDHDEIYCVSHWMPIDWPVAPKE